MLLFNLIPKQNDYVPDHFELLLEMSNIQGYLKEQLKHAEPWQKMEIPLSGIFVVKFLLTHNTFFETFKDFGRKNDVLH